MGASAHSIGGPRTGRETVGGSGGRGAHVLSSSSRLEEKTMFTADNEPRLSRQRPLLLKVSLGASALLGALAGCEAPPPVPPTVPVAEPATAASPPPPPPAAPRV